ncbi:DUF4190 domain-containing protein [Leucobacter sp. USCH14]|uniref:DUF4190 domain-containing protein n=1 Tax=Leucobacter sp. USCH14 TaxID=3024838 RepID=UPI0030A9F347
MSSTSTEAEPTPQAYDRSFNPLAIVAFVGSFFIGLVGIVCGHIALRQLKRQPGRGRGFALAGTIIGYVNVACIITSTIVLTTLVLNGGFEKSYDIQRDFDPLPGETVEIDPPDEFETDSAAANFENVCDAVDDLLEIDVVAAGADREALAALHYLSESESSNAATYADAARLLESGAAGADIDDQLADDLTLALTDEYVMCTAYGDDVL